MTSDQLYSLVQQIVVLVTGLPGEKVIKADQAAPAPLGEYATIDTKRTSTMRGQAIIRMGNTPLVNSPIGQVNNVEHDIRPQLVTQVSVNFYRGDAHGHAADLLESNKRPDISQLLFLSGAGWQQAGPLNDLTVLQSMQHEPRAQLTIYLMHERTQKVETNAIYSTNIVVESEAGDQLETITTDAPVGA